MDVLPYELIEEILLYINFELARSINNQFKQIADEREISKGRIVTIDGDVIFNFIQNKPSQFIHSYIDRHNYTYMYYCLNINYSPKGYNDGYIEYKTNSDDTNIMPSTSVIPLTSIIDYYYEYVTYTINDNSNNNFIIPTSFIILYSLRFHPLFNNQQFKDHSIKYTIDYYIEHIKQLSCSQTQKLKIINNYKLAVSKEYNNLLSH